MKNQLIISSLLAVLFQSCSSGSSGSAAGGTTLPTVNTEWSKVETGLLLKGSRCINVPNTAVSIRNYITKLDSFKIQMEIDLYDKPNCELAVGPNIIDTTKSIRTTTNETANTVDASFKDLRLVHLSSEEMALTQAQVNLLNNDVFCGGGWSIGVYKSITNCYPSVSDGFVSGFTFKYDSSAKKMTLPNGDIFE